MTGVQTCALPIYRGLEYEAEIEKRYEQGYAALRLMENHLSKHNYFVAGRYSIADICLFAYTHVAHEGGYDLTQFPAIQAWIERVMSQSGYISITEE